MTPAGHLRLLTGDERTNFVSSGGRLKPAGMRWLPTKLNVPVEVREGSMEYGLCLSSSYRPTPKELSEWPSSALYFVLENFFVTRRFNDLRELVLRKPEVAKLFLSAQAFGGNPRLSHRNLERAQDFVRVLYAASASRAALREIEK